MGIIRQTLAVKLLLSEFEKESSAISAIELIKRLGSQVNKTTIYRLLNVRGVLSLIIQMYILIFNARNVVQ